MVEQLMTPQQAYTAGIDDYTEGRHDNPYRGLGDDHERAWRLGYADAHEGRDAVTRREIEELRRVLNNISILSGEPWVRDLAARALRERWA